LERRRHAKSAGISETNRAERTATVRARMSIMEQYRVTRFGGSVASQLSVCQGNQAKRMKIRTKPSEAMRTAAETDLRRRLRSMSVGAAESLGE